MFQFQNLNVYIKAKGFYSDIQKIIKENRINRIAHDQLIRASWSVVLNIAEGSGRFSSKDRKNFFIISRSSVFEVVAILDVLQTEKTISFENYNSIAIQSETLSKILYAMIKNLESK